MINSETTSIKDVSVLTQSIEFVVRNLVKLLIGKISLVRLQELIQTVFVEEAENHLKKDYPDRSVPLTNLAVVTGLDTRKLTQILNSGNYRRSLRHSREFLDGITPESCVIDLWTSNPRFTEAGTREPRVIDIWGKECSFEILVKEAVRSRGITVTSVIDRMKHNRQVKVHDGNRIELTTKELAPVQLREKIGDIKLGLDAVGHLLGTVHRNLKTPDSGEAKFFQRGSWTHRLLPQKREILEAEAQKFLSRADDSARKILERYEEDEASPGQLTAGIGLYYFESETF